VTSKVTLFLYITVLRILPFVVSFFLSYPNTIDAWPEPGPAQRAAQGNSFRPSMLKSPGLHKNNHT